MYLWFLLSAWHQQLYVCFVGSILPTYREENAKKKAQRKASVSSVVVHLHQLQVLQFYYSSLRAKNLPLNTWRQFEAVDELVVIISLKYFFFMNITILVGNVS